MVSRLLILPAAALFGLSAVDASAQDAGHGDTPRIVASLSECLTITADTQRLQCLDTAARAIDSALRSGDLLVVDRQQATQARRQAFGTSSAPADILQPARPADRIDSIETTLTRASQAGDGRWTFVLADGSTWNQVDTDRVRINNRAGETVRVRRGALGSFLLVVGRSGAVRVRRQQP